MNTDKNINAFFSILNIIDKSSDKSQRVIARESSLSLGKVNFLLKELTKKGLIKIDRFINSNNKWAYRYLLTSKGIKEKIEITKEFLSRKENEYLLLKKEIELLRQMVDRNDT